MLRRLSVSVRSALAAAAVVAVASLLAGGVLLVVARGLLIDNVNSAVDDRASRLAAALAGGGSDLSALLRPSARDHTVVQVLDASGSVVAASDALTGQGPISPLRPAVGQRRQEQRWLPGDFDDPFRIVSLTVQTPDGVRIVLAGESLDTVDDDIAAIAGALALGLPLLAAVVGGATFLFVGRTLRPVEAMRRQAALITSRNLHERLPVPPVGDEVAALAETMNTMLDRIEAASAAQRSFVGDASHELRSPLATVQANADLLDRAGLPQPAARSVSRIRAESARMARLVEDLLLLARFDDTGSRRPREDVDLDDIVYGERERLRVEQPHLDVRVTLDPVRVTGDADALLRAVRNLVDNAARHAAHLVTIALSSPPGRALAEIVISNDGPPIPAADRDRIFGRFVRLDDSRSRTDGGSGLGLAIARDIVTAHGGTITVDDLDEGVAMRIRLPLP